MNPNALHTLFLLHGIFSTVEDTYQAAVVDRMIDDGGYDQVIGYDYPWLDTLDHLGPEVGAALSSLNLTYVDIAAHSYGTLVAIAALNNMTTTGAAFPPVVQNLMLVEGPLDGAMIADPNFFVSFLLTYPQTKHQFNKQGAYALVDSADVLLPKWVSQFTSGNSAVHGLESNLSQYPFGPLRVIQVAGTSVYANQELVYEALAGHPTTDASDGVIGLHSALCACVGAHTSTDLIGGPTVGVEQLTQTQTHTSLIDPNDLSGLDAIMQQEQFVIYNVMPDTISPTSDATFDMLMKGVGANAPLFPTGEQYESDVVTTAPSSGYITQRNLPYPYDSTLQFLSFEEVRSPGIGILPPASAATNSGPTDHAVVRSTLYGSDGTVAGTIDTTANFYVYPDCAHGCPAGTAQSYFRRVPFRVAPLIIPQLHRASTTLR